MFLGRAVTTIAYALHPAWWALLYQLPIGLGLAYLLARPQARPGVSDAAVWRVAAVCGGGGALAFLVIMGLGASALTALLALAVMWVGTSFALDKYLDVDWESSQRLTGILCGPIWIVWLIIGAVLIVLRAGAAH
jgi:hypothetical protein